LARARSTVRWKNAWIKLEEELMQKKGKTEDQKEKQYLESILIKMKEIKKANTSIIRKSTTQKRRKSFVDKILDFMN
jgi:hypothetical protein